MPKENSDHHPYCTCARSAEHDDEKEVYIVWATAQQGDGKVMKLGEYEDVTYIEINTSIIGPDVLITIERTVV